jgi:polysaccharide biosynthesis protein PelG
MAGIGFMLHRLIRADGLSANLSGLGHATLASSGPWITTCVTLILISVIGHDRIDLDTLRRFSILVTYNFSFSLVGSGAIILVATRHLADCLYEQDLRKVPALLVGSLTIVFAVLALIGFWIYGVLTDLSTQERIFGFIGLLVTGGIWLAAAFMSALKSYTTITVSFVVGMFAGSIFALLLVEPYGLSGLLAGFTVGLAAIFFSLIVRITIEFPGSIQNPFSFIKKSRSLWQLGLIGLLMNCAIWVDKWVMWFAPGAATLGQGLFANESYEAAMFLAYLSIVPSLALMLIDTETAFFECYTNFYRKISLHATLEQLRKQHSEIKRILNIGLKRVVLLQTAICLISLVLAPTIVTAIGGGQEMVPILRYGLVGALFHMLLIANLMVFAYFDLRKELLIVSALFLLLNFFGTIQTVFIGGEYFGYGYCIAAIFSFCISYLLASRRLNQLLFQTFVANNPTLVSSPQN